MKQVAPNLAVELRLHPAALRGHMPTRFRIVLASVLLFASCRSMTPIEIALYERTQGQLFLLARDPEITYARLGRPDVVQPDGPWTYYEWRFSGRVYDRITVVRAEGYGGSPFQYHYVPAGSDTKLSNCVLRAWIKVKGHTTHLRDRIGPDKGVCLQLLGGRFNRQAATR